MSKPNQPSIFTARESFVHKPTTPPTAGDTPTRAPKTSSPFGRQVVPDHLHASHEPALRGAQSLATTRAPPSSHPTSAPITATTTITPITTSPPASALHPTLSASRLDTAAVTNGLPLEESHVGIIPLQQSLLNTSSPLQTSPTWALSGGIADARHAATSNNSTTAVTPSGTYPPPPRPPPRTPQSAQSSAPRKRPAPGLHIGSVSEPHPKRPRFTFRQTKHTLEGFNFTNPGFSPPPLQPPSPLFFSNSPHPRPQLPARFSSSEAGARMLSKTRTEDSHVKTVSLARGTISTPGLQPTSAPRSEHGSTGSRKSSERALTVRSISPDVSLNRNGEGKDLSGLINSIGVVELLEQDDRPTFIVDLGDHTNYGPGQLHLIFANTSLRSYPGMMETVSGVPSEADTPGINTFLQFKSWLLSASVNGESLNVCLPSFIFSGVTWNCSTLQKRLRIISGVTLSSPSSVAPMHASGPPSLTTTQSLSHTRHEGPVTREAPDYFAGALPSAKTSETPSAISPDVKMTVVPSIEPAAAETVGPSFPKDLDLFSATDLLPSTHTYVNSDSGVPAASPPSPAGSAVDALPSQISTVASDAPFFDWTRLPLISTMPEHIQFARSVDWANTKLGPIELWSSDLRQMCNLIMASPHPAAMYWGDDLVAIYNEAYIMLAGQKHPVLMGQSYKEAWAEIWDDVKGAFDSARLTGEATMKDDDCLFIKRNNYLEETYFSWSIIPMVGRDGSVVGLYNPAFEKTRRKIAERRMLTLREVGERTASARDVRGFWAQVQGSFEFNEYDSPFVLLYSVADETDSDASSMHSNSVLAPRQCTLEGSLGVPEGHPAAPYHIDDLKSSMEGFAPVFREVMKTDKPVLLEAGSRDLPESLLEGLHWRGFGDPVRAVVVCPIHPTTGESVLGFLVLGVNPRRPYDDDYSLFVQLLSRQLATSLASVVLFEEEIRRGQKAAKLAALDRIELSEQLAARTQEAIESETKFTRMAEFAPVGMFIASSEGKITFANDTWYDISRVPKDSNMADTWMDAVKPEDVGLVQKLWEDLVVKTESVSSEFRFRAQWEDRSGNRSDTWVLFSAYPEKYPDGRLKSVFGSVTNISQQKWAEGIQTRKMEEAVELKRQQENFIDITSHEMRNPLSAILQCSDEITRTLTEYKNSEDTALPEDLVASCLDAAQIINLCSQHQKRIVDDILTLSKLDSQLLLVTPVDAQPLTVVQRALKMHEGELQAADIQLKFVVDQSYRNMQLDWVRLDPSRVLQVLINLTTNAIKFTGTEKKRTITVSIAASTKRPSELERPAVKYFATRSKRKDSMAERDWGEGEIVYIQFAVQDTGRGLNPEEEKMLFLRFSQASPRTHVQYGGSGLGLFISRELTELQGGEIGVRSESGKGSTFAFYVAARRSTAPPDADSGMAMRKVDNRNRMASPKKGSLTGAAATPRPASAAPIQSRVLIVEDNLVNQRVLQKQLKNLGTEVHLANHGGEALERLRQSTYWADPSTAAPGPKLQLGVVLMDQEMPVMDGLTCTRKIREFEQQGKLTGHVPIIAVTANARAEQIQTALSVGMDDVVSKPFRIPDLLPKIEELLQRYPPPEVS